MDDAYYVGPGEPSAVTRGKAPAVAGIYGAIGTGQCGFPPFAPAQGTALLRTRVSPPWSIADKSLAEAWRVLPSSSDSADPRPGQPFLLNGSSPNLRTCSADTDLLYSSAESTWSVRPRQPLVAVARRIRFSRTLAKHRRPHDCARWPEHALHPL